MSLGRISVGLSILGAAGLTFGVFLLGAGCTIGSETVPPDGGTGPTYKYPTDSSFCTALAQAICNDNVVTACYSSITEENKANCVSEFSRPENCNPEYRQYHPETAEDCIATWQAAYTDATLNEQEIEDTTEAHLLVFNDRKGVSAPCQSESECDIADGLRCVIKEGATDGTCQTPLTTSGGRRCDGLDAVCAPGTYCHFIEGENRWLCVERPAVGEECEPIAPCVESAYCVGGFCVAKKADSAECAADYECTGGFCDKPQGSDTGRCVSSVVLNPNSGYCAPFQL